MDVKSVLLNVLSFAALLWLIADNAAERGSFILGVLDTVLMFLAILVIWLVLLRLSGPNEKKRVWWVAVIRDATPTFFGPFKTEGDAENERDYDSAIYQYRKASGSDLNPLLDADIVNFSISELPKQRVIITQPKYTAYKTYAGGYRATKV